MPNINTASQAYAEFCSGTGSTIPTSSTRAPGRKLTPYKLIDLADIRIAVDDPLRRPSPPRAGSSPAHTRPATSRISARERPLLGVGR